MLTLGVASTCERVVSAWGQLLVCATLLSACSDAGRAHSGLSDAGDPPDAAASAEILDARLQREAAFWQTIEICGEWVEDAGTVSEMVERADAIVFGKIVGAATGNTFQGDAAEDFYAEANLRVDVTQDLIGTHLDGIELSVILPRVVEPSALDSAIASLQRTLPEDPVVLLLRKRADFDHLYRLVSDKALWARTARAELDNPLAETRCAGHWGDSVQEQFLGNVSTLDDLVGVLRAIAMR